MSQMLGSLQKHLDRTDIIGYAAARNTRILQDELQEYEQARNALVRELGKDELDDGGNPTGRIVVPAGSDEYGNFVERIMEFANIEHDPNIFKIKYDQAIGRISGTELLEIEWMFED